MDVRLLRYFVTVVEEGSITRAAKRLNMSQPPLSKQMRQLEEEMGVILFIRGKKNIQLTEAGSFFKTRAEEIIYSVDTLERQIREYKDGNKGRIIIGAVEAVATNYLPQILNAFRKKYEDVTYEIWSGSTDDILRKLDKGVIDIGFIRNAYDENKYNSFELLQDSWGVLISEKHRLAEFKEAFITADMLVGEPLIIPSTRGRVEELRTWFAQAGVEPDILCNYNVLAIGEALVKEELGLALVLADYRKVGMEPHLIYKKLKPELHSAVNVLWSKNHYLTESASRLVEFIMNEME